MIIRRGDPRRKQRGIKFRTDLTAYLDEVDYKYHLDS